MNNYFIYADKNTTVKLSDGKSFGAMDISGSTAGSILNNQIKVARNLLLEKVVLWNNRVKDIVNPNIYNITSCGGTSPQHLFTDLKTINALSTADCFVFFTDGQVSQKEVEETAKHVDKVSHMPTIMIVTHCNNSFSSINISVFSPFISGCSNCVLFSCNTSENGLLRLIKAKGCFSTLGQNPDLQFLNGLALENFPVISISKLLNLEMTLMGKAPPGCISLGEKYMNLDLLFNSVLTVDELTIVLEYIEDILLSCKTNGNLPLLRKWLNKHYSSLDELKIDNHNEISLMNEIRILNKEKHDKNSLKIQKLRKRLLIARKLNDKERKDNYEQLKQLKNIRSFIQQALSKITSLEKAGYSADILASLSNRAMRAERVNINKDISINWENCHVDECCICFENGPMALLVRSVEDVEQNTSNWSLDFPLAFGSSSYNDIILPDEICYNCALRMNKISPIGREDICIVLPLVPLRRNIDLWNNNLALALSKGIKTTNLFLIFFSILEHKLGTAGWCDQYSPIMRSNLKYVYNDILQNYKTSSTFRDGGEYVPLKEAIVNSLNEDILYDYPIAGTSLLLRVAKEENLCEISNEKILTILHNRLIRHIISKYMGIILKDDKEGSTFASDFRMKCREKLYTCRWGIPIDGTAKLITDVSDLLSNYEIEALERTCIIKDLQCFKPAAMTVVIFKMLDYTVHNTVSNICMILSALDQVYIDALNNPSQVNSDYVLSLMNEKYHYGEIDKEHLKPPDFSNEYGASVLKCICGYKFLNMNPSLKNIQECCDRIKQRRKEHFKQIFNADTEWGMPGARSRSFNLHRSIRAAYNINLSDDDNISNIVKFIVTTDKRGHIYNPNIENDVRSILPSYKLFAKNINFSSLIVYLPEKLRKEANL